MVGTRNAENCIKLNVYSPLWHHMQFELAFDKKLKKFCQLTEYNEDFMEDSVKRSEIKKSPKHIQHIAIRQHRFKNYCGKNNLPLSYSELKARCLKQEGYKVINISPHDLKQLSELYESFV